MTEKNITEAALEKYFHAALAWGVPAQQAQNILDTLARSSKWEDRPQVERVVEAHTILEVLARRNAAESGSEMMIRMTPKPGDLVLLKIKGWVGKLVWCLQALNGDFSKWTHVAIMLDDDTVFEAQPGGAVVTPWSEYTGREFTIVTRRLKNGKLIPLKLDWATRAKIVGTARGFVGTPYNWGTYFYLAAYRVGIRPRWLKERVQNPERLICSQAGDAIYALADVHLFDDGRMPCDVTPGDLGRLS